jgi:hypothetical protein
MEKKAVVAYFKGLSQRFLEGLMKTKKMFSQDSRHSDEESNPGPPYTRQEC